MKIVTAIIKPFRLEAVKDALQSEGLDGMTVSEVQGLGRQAGHLEAFRGSEYQVDFVPKVKVELVVSEEDAERAVNTIVGAAGSQRIGDGKVWIGPVDTVIRIRTDERDHDAI